MKSLTLYCLLLFSSLSLSAATITWNGGSGNWDDPTMWSSGSLPTAVDSVIITNSGKVFILAGINAQAASVNVHAVDTLMIANSSTLSINNSAWTGLVNVGMINNKGNISISNTGHIGLLATGSMINYRSGVITITSTNGGLFITALGQFKNAGQIIIDDSSSDGLSNDGWLVNKAAGSIEVSNSRIFRQNGRMYNFGAITIANTTSNGLSHTGSEMINERSGSISIDQAGDNGLYTNATFSNRGEVSISNTTESGISLFQQATLSNGKRGEIYLSDVGTYGIEARISCNLLNIGLLLLSSIGGHAIALISSTLENGGELFLKTDQLLSIDVNSTFHNEACATVVFAGAISNGNSFTNDGWLYSTSTIPHFNGNLFLNNGVIEDINDSFDGVGITNSAVRAAPLNVTGTEGLAIPDALDLGSLAGFQITDDKWYTTAELVTEAGDYDPVLNEFTPVAAAVGLSIFFMRIEDLNNNCQAVFQVEITGGVVAAGPAPPPSLPPLGQAIGQTNFQSPASFEVYPNPAAEGFTLQSKSSFAPNTSLTIYDWQGRVVLEKKIAEGLNSFYVDLNTSLLAGVYVATLSQDGQQLFNQRLVVGR